MPLCISCGKTIVSRCSWSDIDAYLCEVCFDRLTPDWQEWHRVRASHYTTLYRMLNERDETIANLRTQLKDAGEVIEAAEEHGKGCPYAGRVRFKVNEYRAKYGEEE